MGISVLAEREKGVSDQLTLPFVSQLQIFGGSKFDDFLSN